MDYSNGITVFIGNEGFYAEGELRDRAITLPVSGSELQGFFEEEQVGLSDLMGTLRDAAEHKHDTRDNTHSHDIDAR